MRPGASVILPVTAARRWPWLLLACVLAVLLAACGSAPKRGGGYYKDDGPHARVPSDLDKVPDAVPRVEPYASGPNRPYSVFGKKYVPDTSGRAYRNRGTASWYGKKFHGQPTSNGETYDMYKMTAAHPTLPIPSYAKVTRTANGRSVIVRINDRGPFHDGRIIDLSYAAAHRLDIIAPGSGEVLVEWISPDDIRGNRVPQPSGPAPAVALAVPPDPAPALSTSGVSGSSSGIFLQLGAFGSAENANAFLAQMRGALNNDPRLRLEQGGNGIYRVRLGPYPDRRSAEDAASHIGRQLGISPSIALQP
ncbi:septal ring lytic transglycosylase RlpA family protein [Kerstersia sp.]|uniref:septal ring lytic transglycosylase RlpA family protein n=1 Tax=Kerstersia sp. TaxID=1930783 RepID=UPI003F93501B